MWNKLYIAVKELFSSVFVNIVVFTLIILITIILEVFLLLKINFTNYIDKNFSSSIPPNTIKITPRETKEKKINLFFIKKSKPKKGTRITYRDILKFKKLKGVKTVYPLMSAKLPIEAIISIFGLRYRTDLVCIGAPYSMVKHDIKRKYRRLWLNWKQGDMIPSLMARVLLDTYNDSMASPNGLPKISEEFAIGKTYQILFGKSAVKSLKGFYVEKAVLAGFTTKINTIAIVLPLKTVYYYNKKFKQPLTYDSVYIKVKDHESLINVSKEIKRMKFVVETKKSLSRQILNLQRNVELLFNILFVIIAAIGIVSVFISGIISSLQRIEYYKLLRILGASKLYIAFIIIFKYGIIGFLAAYSGNILTENFAKLLKPIFNIPYFKPVFTLPITISDNIILYATALTILSSGLAIIISLFKQLNNDL